MRPWPRPARAGSRPPAAGVARTLGRAPSPRRAPSSTPATAPAGAAAPYARARTAGPRPPGRRPAAPSSALPARARLEAIAMAPGWRKCEREVHLLVEQLQRCAGATLVPAGGAR